MTEQDQVDDELDPIALLVEAKAERRALRRLPTLLLEAVRLSWSASPGRFLTTTTLQVAGSLLVGVQILLGKQALSRLLEADRKGASPLAALPLLATLALVVAVAAAATIVSGQQQRVLSELVRRSVWRRILDVTEAVELNAFETPEFNDQLQRVRTNAVLRPLSISQGLVQMASGLAGAVALTIALFSLSPVLPPILLLAGIPLWLLSRKGGRLEFDFAVEQTPEARRRDYLSELLTSREPAKELRAFNSADVLRDRYEHSYAGYLADLHGHIRRRVLLSLASTVASAAATAGALTLLVVLVSRGQVQLAEAGAAAIAIPLLGSRLTLVFSGMGSILESGLFLRDLDAFLELRPAAVAVRGTASAPAYFEQLTVRDLSFTYPGSPSPAIQDVNLSLRRGQVVALVGENGSGKTTLAKLLARLYEPDAGQVLWDDVDVLSYEPSKLREAIAVIFQDFIRYQLSAADNIGLGRPPLVDDLVGIAEAARHSGADRVIDSLPLGYRTLLSREYSGGRDLSLGQWQRIALARAFFRDAEFVILDEPSASLDARAEHDLFERIRTLLAGRSVLLISHRFSSVRSADYIYVLHEGRVVEEGSHAQLMARDHGRYRELFTLQAAAYLDEVPAPPAKAPARRSRPASSRTPTASKTKANTAGTSTARSKSTRTTTSGSATPATPAAKK